MIHGMKYLVVASSMLPLLSSGWERDEINFNKIEEKAKELASRDYNAPDKESLPGWMKNLTYDQYRDIRFLPERSLWSADNMPFRAQFFHPGYLFREPVILNEFTASHTQEVRFSQDYFSYGSLVGEHSEEKGDAGYAGFKLHSESTFFSKAELFAISLIPSNLLLFLKSVIVPALSFFVFFSI